jgi:hypothetical protein
MERQTLKQEQPTLTFAEISKEIGRRWRLLSPDEKKTYLSESEPIADGMHTPVLEQEQEQESAELVVRSAGRVLEETMTPAAAAVDSDDEETVAQFEEIPKVKKAGKKTDRPADLDEMQKGLWDEFSSFKISELRKQCENNNLKTSKFRRDMVMSLITHRMALENGHLPMEDDERSLFDDDED